MNKFLALVLLLINFGVLSSQNEGEVKKVQFTESNPLTYARQIVIQSAILNEIRTVNVFLPESFNRSSAQRTYPVLLLLEDEFFLMTCGVIKHLSAVERIPETIVVSLVDDPYIPKLYTNGSDFWPKEWKQLPFGGDPDPFTRHLEQELFPYLKANYRANNFRMIMGLSGTSIYTLHAFTKEPDLFDAHIAIASGDILGMGYDEGESFIDLIVRDFQDAPDRKGYLYVTSADSDTEPNSPMIRENLENLEERLAPYRSENFKFISKIFPNERHYDVALPALSEALELIFPIKSWSAEYREIIKAPSPAMKNIDDHFRKLSEQYGFEILPKTERWNSGNSLSRIGPNLLRQGKTVEAIEVIERWAELDPKSIPALDNLSKAYEANSQIEKALSTLEEAYKISNELEREESGEFQIRIDQLKKQLAKMKN